MILALVVCAVAAADPLSGEALYSDVERYASFGIHQTGGPGDRATSDWLAKEMEAAGYLVERHEFTFTRFELEQCRLRIGNSEIEAFPFWFPVETPADGVNGKLMAYTENADLRGKIAFVSAEEAGRRPYFESANDWAKSASERGASGLIIEVASGSGDVPAINAVEPYVQRPLPIPSVIVGTSSRPILNLGLRNGDRAEIVIQGAAHEVASASNVIARLVRGPKWLVVTTPSSGWFTCAGERGPGVALFLGLARYLAECEFEYSILFMANSGHEMGTLGAHRILDEVAPPPSEVLAWIHLGASISTRRWEMGASGVEATSEPEPAGNLVATASLLPRVQKAFAGVSWLAPRSSGPVAGELEHFIDAGYEAFGFFGPHYYFHTTYDTPETTGPELLAPIGEGLRRFVDSL